MAGLCGSQRNQCLLWTPTFGPKTVIVEVHVLVDVAVDGRMWLRSGPFEGPTTKKPPALPEDPDRIRVVT